MLLRHIHARLQHDHAERNARDPADKKHDCEYREDEKDDPRSPLSAVEVIDGRSQRENTIEDTGDPDELLGKGTRGDEIRQGDDEGDDEHEDEEDQRVGVEGEIVGAIVDAAAGEGSMARIRVDGQAGDGDKAEENEDELESKLD